MSPCDATLTELPSATPDYGQVFLTYLACQLSTRQNPFALDRRDTVHFLVTLTVCPDCRTPPSLLARDLASLSPRVGLRWMELLCDYRRPKDGASWASCGFEPDSRRKTWSLHVIE